VGASNSAIMMVASCLGLDTAIFGFRLASQAAQALGQTLAIVMDIQVAFSSLSHGAFSGAAG
jgi:hypothetical protein